MEISIGDYVRTDNGIIGKYVKYRGWQDTIETNNKWIGFDIDKDIVKHSKDIIDLIEKDDYVNGKRVIKANCRFTYIDDDSSYGESEIENGLDLGDELIYWSSEIKSIITKEQIKQIEFRIKE